MNNNRGKGVSVGRIVIRYLTILALVAVVGLACAIVTGLIIGNTLVSQLNASIDNPRQSYVTPPPLDEALSSITTLRMNISAETSSGIVLLTGNAIFVAPSPDTNTDIPDFYLHWNIISPPDEGEMLLLDGRLLSRYGVDSKWTQNTALAGEVIDLLTEDLLAENSIGLSGLLTPLLGISFSSDMYGWDYLPESTLNGQSVKIYAKDDLGVLIWQIILPQYRDIFRSADTEIAIGTKNNLPYHLKYTLHLGLPDKEVTESLIFVIQLSGFNEPVVLADPLQAP